MKIAKGRQKSQHRHIHRHSLNGAAISAVARADAPCAEVQSLGPNLSIGAALGCRSMSSGAETPGARPR
jgi:hypothetical protein